tara:strand:- start:922 stop:2415 length:1494 start_codon:yes stop_codon:yes gene_type:complete
MITKDVSGNADFIFGVDMDRMMIDNSAYSNLIENMTDVAKKQIAANSEILSFNMTRRQVKKELSLNSIGSPQKPEVFSDETISHQVLGSVGEMGEVQLSVSGQASGTKYLTASDIGLSKQTAGTYQYELSISTIDGFIPTINNLLKKLYRTSNDISNYTALIAIPDNYDSGKKRTKISIKKSTTDRMSKSYVDALSYFQNLKNVDTEYKRASSLIASSVATKESIGTFQKRLNSVISKAEALIYETGAGVSPSSVANKSANSGLPNAPTIEIKQSFNNTISVESKDNKFVDYFKGKGEIGGGLNLYSSTEVKISKPETIYIEAQLSALDSLEARGVTFTIIPIIESTALDTSVREMISSEKYIDSSVISVGGLLKDDLSSIDLSEVSAGDLVNVTDINAAVSSMVPKLSSVNSFQAPVDKITKVMPKEITTSVTTMPQTMVLVASKTSATKSSESMLKSLEWKSIEEVNSTKGAIVLCKQDDGSAEVANGYFLMEIK